MPTDKQRLSNRRNAQRSTGPRTSAGKARSSRNAIKHGILARHVVLDGLDDHAAFDVLLTGLRDDLDPQGALDDRLVELVAVSYWRLQRALQAQAGATRLALDPIESEAQAEHDRTLAEAIRALRIPHSSIWWQRHADTAAAHYPALLRTPDGCDWLITQLTEAVALLQSADDPQHAIQSLSAIFCSESTPLGKLAESQRRVFSLSSTPSVDGTIIPLFLDAAIHRKCEIQAKRAELADHGNSDLERRKAAVALPNTAELDRILRYEKTITNELYRALAELDRRRRTRAAASTLKEP